MHSFSVFRIIGSGQTGYRIVNIQVPIMPSGNDFPIHLPVGTNRDKEVGGKLQKESCPLFAGTVPAKDILVRTGVPEVAFAFGLATKDGVKQRRGLRRLFYGEALGNICHSLKTFPSVPRDSGASFRQSGAHHPDVCVRQPHGGFPRNGQRQWRARA